MAKKNLRSRRSGSQTHASSNRAWIVTLVVAVIVVGFLVVRGTSESSETNREAKQRATDRPNNQFPVEPSTFELQSVPRVRATDARRLVEEEQAVIIDVRDIESYRTGHVPGALQIPLGFVQGELPHFPRDRRLIAYCT